MSTASRPSASADNVYEERDRATAADLVFGAHPQLRALAEVYAGDGAPAKFVRAFVDA